ncbi:MAG: hypothetical protein LUH55_06960 [Bacteroides thetaiotaomicron]|nr:hypothetical protein [Bacteroides thetaiotaomicron]
MTRMRIRHTDQEWFDMIRDCMACGLTITDWCRQQDITIKAFYYHVNQLRQKGYPIPQRTAPVRPQEKPAPFFVDIKAASAEEPKRSMPDAYAAVIRIDFHGITIGISNDAAQDAISHTLHALQAIC